MNSFKANILVAEDNEVNRNLIRTILKTKGYHVFEAAHADEAIEALEDREFDLALIDINMSPRGGFEFIRHLIVTGTDLPVVVITGDGSSDVLSQVHALGVERLIHKPIDPDLLLKIVSRILERRGVKTNNLGAEIQDLTYDKEELMDRVLELARENVQKNEGGPFSAIVVNEDGRILSEAQSGHMGRIDPIAHAEILAIRRATEKSGRADLSSCVLYCACEPTDMGKALIKSVGIEKVYYGLSQKELGEFRPRAHAGEPAFESLQREEARALFHSILGEK